MKGSSEAMVSAKFYLMATAIVIAAAMLLSSYNSWLRDNLMRGSCETLEEVLHQQKLSFSLKINEKITSLYTIANLIDEVVVRDEEGERASAFLNNAIRGSSFKHLTLADLNGDAVNSNGLSYNISSRENFQLALEGRDAISDPVDSFADGSRIISVAVPVVNNKGAVIGVLSGIIDVMGMEDLFYASFGGDGHAYVTDENGAFISATHNTHDVIEGERVAKNIFDVFEVAILSEVSDAEEVAQNMKVGEHGHIRLVDKTGGYVFVHYMPLDINKWYIFSLAPDDVVSKNAALIMERTLLLSLFIVMGFTLLMAYMAYSNKQYSDNLYRTAYHDELTGAPNFARFKKDAARLLKNYPDVDYILVRLHIGKLDILNELYGNELGDSVIKSAAKSLEKVICEKTEPLGHAGGDRFYVLMKGSSDDDVNERHAQFEKTFSEQMGDFDYKISFPKGVYFIQKGESLTTALEKVNFAHKQAQQATQGKIKETFDEGARKMEMFRADIENRMEVALENREFKLFLQPKFYLNGDTIAGAEALVRWSSDGSTVLPPGDFIPIFEKNGFVTKIDMYMFDCACEFLKKTIDRGGQPITVSVNFSRLHLDNAFFVSELCQIADKWGVPHHYLEIELTESAALNDEDMLIDVLSLLHERGFTLSIDDFGSGYSSLGLLKNIPVDVVKFDRSFFVDPRDEGRSKLVVQSVVGMAKSLKIHTVAEGVETQEQIDMLRSVGCEIVQGYFYAKPMPCDQLVL